MTRLLHFSIWVLAGLGRLSAADHWAFRPVRRVEPPAVRDSSWVRNPIDAFILARLEAVGLSPSPEADRVTLIRRLSLDLLGLPPSPEEVDAFVSDPRPEAYDELADRLLASPHHAERAARQWLDLARYGDSNGYTIDGSRSIWKYRDWVIDALRADLPFDRFAIAQLAGDLLPGATREDLIATGFHRNTLRNEEGGTDPEQFRVEAIADRVSTTATVFLGLTLACARCHDHKFDPLTQRDYYRFFAFFNSADEPAIQVPSSQEARELPALETEVKAARKLLADQEAAVTRRQEVWERDLAGHLAVEWKPLETLEAAAAGGARLEGQPDGSVLASRPAAGAVPAVPAPPEARSIYRVSCAAPLSGMTALRIEAIPHPSLPQNGPGLGPRGAFELSEVRLLLGPSGAPVPLVEAAGDLAPGVTAPSKAIDGDPATGWSFLPTVQAASGAGSVPRNLSAVFILKEGAIVEAGGRLEVRLEGPSSLRALGSFRLSVTAAPRGAASLPPDVRESLARPAAERSIKEKERVAAHFRSFDKDYVPLVARVADLQSRQEELRRSITTTLVLSERKEPRETRVHIRGDFLRPGEKVEGGVPAVLPPLRPRGERTDRLDLARWLVSPENPLTPRVAMNRLWQECFGAGLVATENDFGTQGEPPTHPELLDYLASELVARSWSLRAMRRLLVTSAAYRQASRPRRDLDEADPRLLLHGRQGRLRLDAESLRDSALAASGLLSREIGGPGVYPPQPQGVFRFTQTAKYWKESQGGDRYRRAMYTFFWRSSPYPFLLTFDAPDGTTACTRRSRSNTPLQALTLANDPAFVEMAKGLASRALGEAGPGDEARIVRAFRRALARTPSERETARLRELLARERVRFALSSEEAAAAAPADLPAGISAPEGAAWTALARVILNLDEFVTRE